MLPEISLISGALLEISILSLLVANESLEDWPSRKLY